MGSLKTLEKVLATVIGERDAYTARGALHGIYNLRLADAHVFSKYELDEAYALAHVDRASPLVMQGKNLLITCVNSLHLMSGYATNQASGMRSLKTALVFRTVRADRPSPQNEIIAVNAKRQPPSASERFESGTKQRPTPLLPVVPCL